MLAYLSSGERRAIAVNHERRPSFLHVQHRIRTDRTALLEEHMKRITTVSALRRALPDFDWKTLRFDDDETMIVQSKGGVYTYIVPDRVWRSPSSPFHEAQGFRDPGRRV